MGASCSSDAGAVRSTDVKITDASIVCEAIFFPDAAMPCRSFLRDQRCTRKRCTFAHEKTSLVKLIRELDGATRTLEVCVFTITCNEIADAIENAAQRGVSVRIITDDDQMKSTGSDVARLAKVQNVAVRHDGDPSSHMHHKFCVIDGVTLINGSFSASPFCRAIDALCCDPVSSICCR